MTENVRLQNLRDFTVQIRDANDQIVGTGIAVSTDGKIVTCAHVVQAAGIDPRDANGAEIGVYYPQLRNDEKKNRQAKVSASFHDYDDDLVLLELIDSNSPLGLERIPVLGTANLSRGDPFNSYGYRKLDIYLAGWSDGIIQGYVEHPSSRKLQVDPVQLKSNQINFGMSGAAVLDAERNLVVGIVSEMWFPDQSMKDSDTAWAVDGQVILNLASLEKVTGLFFQEESYPLHAAPSPKVDIAEAQQNVAPKERFSWHNAPQPLKEWVGRDEFLKALNADWRNPSKHVTGLIGFGGEGKSSLVRKWIDNLINDLSQPQPDGVFWWGFYGNRSVDEFLEAALNYMSGGKIDPRQVQSSNLRAQIIGAMLGAGRYLFVLDGFEVMQHQDGDQYGLLQSNDLRDLLTFFARPDNLSFCLITSRAPLLDLMDYITYTHRDVDRLSEEDGLSLLRRLGVKGSDDELNKVVADWDGHALTLNILAAYLAERFDGNIKHLSDIPVPTADEPRYERVHHVLRRYDEHLTKDEREFLKLFSVFRLPVQESAFEKVFIPLLSSFSSAGTKHKQNFLTRLFGSKTSSDFQSTNPQITNLLNRLVTYRIIRHDEHEKSYTTHPLIRNHYFTLFTKGDPNQGKAAHSQIKDYYLSIAGDTPKFPTLDNLKPLIEVVHHACEAGAYNEAWKIYLDRIRQGSKRVTIHQLAAYETELALVAEFFANHDIAQEPLVDTKNYKSFLINAVGFCLMNLGRMQDVVPYYERSNQIDLDMKHWQNASHGYRNLAELHAYLGALEASAEAARQALDLTHRAEDKSRESQSLSYQAWIAHLHGELQLAKEIFNQAEESEIEFHNHQVGYLYSNRGIQHADHLRRRTGQSDYARRVIEANLNICEQSHWPDTTSQCHRVLGDLDADSRDHASAHEHYKSALKIARGISDRAVLIEALLARGRWAAKYMKIAADAFNDLNEALGYCVESGYRIYEADTRVALAWAYIANDEKQKANEQRDGLSLGQGGCGGSVRCHCEER